jgi:N-acetylneuraminic acid mutarotase
VQLYGWVLCAVVAACGCVPDAFTLEAGAGAAGGGPSHWTTRAPLEAGRTATAWASMGGLFYVAGGWDGETLARLDVYDPVMDAWQPRAAMSVRRDLAHLALEIGGRLYVAFGATPWSETDEGLYCTTVTEIYDPDGDAWEAAGSLPTPLGRCWAGFATVDGNIYVIGGTNTSGIPFNSVLAIDATTWTYSYRAPLPTARGLMAVAVLGNRIYVIGGSDGQMLATVDVYDTVADTWEPAPPLPTARATPCAAVYDDRIYVVGGQADVIGNSTGALEIYDPANGSWSSAEPMPTPRNSPACGVVDGALYVVGGGDGLTYFGVNEAYEL